jgi:hypothetical protein
VAAFVALIAVLLASQPTKAREYTGFPQAKIDHIQVDETGRLRLFVTYLDKEKQAVPLSLVTRLEVKLSAGRGESAALAFESGKPVIPEDERGDPFRGTKPSQTPRAKAEVSLGVLLVAPAYVESPLGSMLVDAAYTRRLDTSMRNGIADFTKQLGPKDYANVILYGDFPYSWIPSKGYESKLTNLAPLALREECAAAAKHLLTLAEAPKPTQGGDLRDLGVEACSLISDRSKLKDVVATSLNLGGYWPNFLGISRPPMTPLPGHEQQKPLEELDPTMKTVMDEALTMLVKSRAPLDQRALVLITDGRDGYLGTHDDAMRTFEGDCARRHADPDPEELRKAGRAAERQRLREGVTLLRKICHQGLLASYLHEEQKAFASKAKRWLALAHAAGVRIHVVGFHSDRNRERTFELARLQLLADESGGTYREARSPDELYDEVMRLADELNHQYVVELDLPFDSGAKVKASLVIDAESSARVITDTIEIVVPERARRGPVGWVERGMRWLEESLGPPWHIVIAVVVAILALGLVLWLGTKVIKLVIAGFKKLIALGGKST